MRGAAFRSSPAFPLHKTLASAPPSASRRTGQQLGLEALIHGLEPFALPLDDGVRREFVHGDWGIRCQCFGEYAIVFCRHVSPLP